MTLTLAIDNQLALTITLMTRPSDNVGTCTEPWSLVTKGQVRVASQRPLIFKPVLAKLGTEALSQECISGFRRLKIDLTK